MKARSLERNIDLYPAFVAATSVLPWLPVFFLYFTQKVGFDEALTLGAVYYAAVVVLEVPSGWLSDRAGRRPTLALACGSLLCAYLGFLVADGVVGLAVCQILLAGGIACQSGSDSALLHDSLAALERRDEYEQAEARARVVSMTTLGVSCLLGGVLGSISLLWPYAVAAVAAMVAFGIACCFLEPPVQATVVADGEDRVAEADSVRACLRDGVLRWLLVWYVLAFALAHVPYEFQQPWIRLLGETEGIAAWMAADKLTPAISGLVSALSMFAGSLGAIVSVRLSVRVGLPLLLLLANAVQVIIVAGLSLILHPALLLLTLGRGFAMSMTHAPLMAAIAPRVASRSRATWLSVQSFCGRLGFSLLLFLIASVVTEDLDWPTLSQLLGVCALSGAAAALLVAWWGSRRTPSSEVTGR